MNGNLVLNGITDPQLVKILEVKIRHENNLNFNPQQMQINPIQTQPQHSGRPAPPQQQQFGNQTYNNVVLGWSSENGLEAVQEIVHYLLKREDIAKAVGQ